MHDLRVVSCRREPPGLSQDVKLALVTLSVTLEGLFGRAGCVWENTAEPLTSGVETLPFHVDRSPGTLSLSTLGTLTVEVGRPYNKLKQRGSVSS